MVTRWLVFLSLTADALVMLLTAGSLPAFAHAYGVPLDVAGLVFTGNGLGYTVAVPLSGALADRYGKRALAAGSALVLALGLLLFALSRSLPAGLVAATLAGAGGGSVESGVTGLLPELYPGREGFANNFAQTFFCLGAMLGPLLLLLPGFGWRLRLGCCGLAFLLLAAGFWRARAGEGRHAGTDAPTGRRPVPGLAASLVAMALYTGVEVAVWGWLFTVVTGPGGAGPLWAVAELSGFWLAMGLGRLGAGLLADRLDLTLLIALETAVGIPALLLTLLWRNPAGALAAVVCLGLAFSGIWPSVVGLAQRRHGGTALLSSVLVAAGGAGSLAVPAAFGFTAAHLGLGTAAAGLAVLLAPVAFLPRLAARAGG